MKLDDCMPYRVCLNDLNNASVKLSLYSSLTQYMYIYTRACAYTQNHLKTHKANYPKNQFTSYQVEAHHHEIKTNN